MGKAIDKHPTSWLTASDWGQLHDGGHFVTNHWLALCPHRVGAETLANAVKGDPDVVEKDRLRSCPYLLYKWSLREKGTPFLHRLFLSAGVPHLAKASCQELRIRFQRPRARAAQAPEQRRLTEYATNQPTPHPSCLDLPLHKPNFQAARHTRSVPLCPTNQKSA